MDILSPVEVSRILTQSALVEKYNINLDRESAYELLELKIKQAEKEDAKKKATEDREKVTRYAPRKSSNRQDPIMKVLTSATFIRGVMSILNKAFK